MLFLASGSVAGRAAGRVQGGRVASNHPYLGAPNLLGQTFLLMPHTSNPHANASSFNFLSTPCDVLSPPNILTSLLLSPLPQTDTSIIIIINSAYANCSIPIR